MNLIHALTLLSPDSSDPFREVQRSGSDAPEAFPHRDWSVRSYTLRGGLQEGVQVVEVHNGRLSFAILPTRGMGIWKGNCGAVHLGWNSPVKDPVHPGFVNELEHGGLGWLKGFNEWFVRCGIANFGPPGVDNLTDADGKTIASVPLTLHGKIANIPARAVSIEVSDHGITVRGEVDEAMMFGPALRLNTEIHTDFGSGALTVIDTVTNLGNRPAEHQMLYHINYGPPLLEEGARTVVPIRTVAPRDPRAAEGVASFDQYGAPQPGFAEQVFFYQLLGDPETDETLAMLRNAAGDQASLLRYSLRDFPYFTVWKNTGGLDEGYVTGLEPSNSFPNHRSFERRMGRVISLKGGASRTTRLRIETLETAAAVEAAENEIATLQSSVVPTVYPSPCAELSGN